MGAYPLAAVQLEISAGPRLCGRLAEQPDLPPESEVRAGRGLRMNPCPFCTSDDSVLRNDLAYAKRLLDSDHPPDG